MTGRGWGLGQWSKKGESGRERPFRLNIRVTDRERRIIRKAALEAGMSDSEWARKKLLAGLT